MAESRKVVPNSERVVVAVEVMSNLLGELFYTCTVCDDTLDTDTVEIHVVGKHKATHLSVLNAPIAKKY